jgi:hypothetical protein
MSRHSPDIRLEELGKATKTSVMMFTTLPIVAYWNPFVLWRVWVAETPFGLSICSITILQVVTTITYYTITYFHSLHSLQANFFTLSAAVFTYHLKGFSSVPKQVYFSFVFSEMLTIITKYLDGIPGELCRWSVKTVRLRTTYLLPGTLCRSLYSLPWSDLILRSGPCRFSQLPITASFLGSVIHLTTQVSNNLSIRD